MATRSLQPTVLVLKTMNAIMGEMGKRYADLTGEVTLANIQTTLDTVLDNPQTRAEFIETLFTKPAYTIINNKVWNNKLARFKKGKVTYGDYVEHIHINPAEGEEFDGTGKVSPFATYSEDIKVEYFKKNVMKTFGTTIRDETIREAFMSDGNLKSFMSAKLNSIFNGFNTFEYATTINMFNSVIKQGKMVTMAIPDFIADPTKTKDVASAISLVGSNMQYMGSEYNSYIHFLPEDEQATATPVETFTDISEQVIICTETFYNKMNFDNLATAYHMSKADLEQKIVRVNTFGKGCENVHVILCDESFPQLRDYLLQSDSQRNPRSLYTNMFYHVFQSYAVSTFANAVCFAIDGKLTPDVGA